MQLFYCRIDELIDNNAAFYSNTEIDDLDVVLLGRFNDSGGVGGGYQNARGSFVKQLNFGGVAGRQRDARADAAEAGLGKCDSKPTIGEIVRGLDQSGSNDLANGLMHALFVIHVEHRR